MSPRTLIMLLALGGLALPAAAPGQVVEEENSESLQTTAAPAPEGETPDLDQVAKLIVEQTNQFRRKHGRQPVEISPELTDAAQYFADYMARTNKYGHTADGQRPAERAAEHGYEYCIVTENIAYQYSSAGFTTSGLAEKFVEGWKESPGHRKNMLDPDVTETGVAVARSEQTGQYYAVQMFGRPKSKRIEFRITNESDTTIQYRIRGRELPLPPRYTRTHEQCRPSKVRFLPPDGEGEPIKTVRPSDGERFVVVEEQGQIQVKANK